MRYISRKFPLLTASVVTVVMATGCYTDFEPGIESDPVLCMNSNIAAGDTISVALTRTWRWDEGHPGYDFDITIYDAEVRLYVNDEYVETLVARKIPAPPYYDPTASDEVKVRYYAGYIPASGDRIRLVADAPVYGHAEAGVEVPFPPEIDRVEAKVSNLVEYCSTPDNMNYTMDANLLVWFTDKASQTDYYKFSTGGYYRSAYEDGNREYSHESLSFYPDYSREPLFTEHVSVLESVISETSGYTIFSDRQISGRSYPLHVSLTDMTYICDNPLKLPGFGDACISLTLTSLSESYYKHVLSVWVDNDGISGALSGVGLANQVSPVSNVSSGAGVVSASASCVYRLPVKDLLIQSR